MSIFKIVSGNSDDYMLYDRLNYIKRPTATEEKYIYGASLSTENTYEEMVAVKKMWDQENGRNFYHLIISPESWENINTEIFFYANSEIAEIISRFYGWRQVVMAVHFDKGEWLHSHFILNNIDIMNGKRLAIDYEKLRELKREVSEILKKYGISQIRQNL
ncbi:MAG: relaxase/mobilization nuclease domain-containing protein [Selenomonadaceae bacterium]|nr:relaxase/mobilization nuclease domain-containing protein [Selenomonadaceae bacterium]